MAAKENDEEEEKEKEKQGIKEGSLDSIPPATAYAFIIIHEIPKRRFRGLSSALRTGSKRLIERGGGEWGREAEEEGSLS